jgi:hypothetical protein
MLAGLKFCDETGSSGTMEPIACGSDGVSSGLWGVGLLIRQTQICTEDSKAINGSVMMCERYMPVCVRHSVRGCTSDEVMYLQRGMWHDYIYMAEI